MLSAAEFRLENGAVVNLHRDPLVYVAWLVERAIERAIAFEIADSLGEAIMEGGVQLVPILKLLYGGKFGIARNKVLPAQGVLRSQFIGSQWPQVRLFEAGLVESNLCAICVGEVPP